MSEESLRRFLDQLNRDTGFVERLKASPAEALEGYDLSATERMALATNDEDGLRRLSGLDTAGFGSPGQSVGLCVGSLGFCQLYAALPANMQTNHDVSVCHSPGAGSAA